MFDDPGKFEESLLEIVGASIIAELLFVWFMLDASTAISAYPRYGISSWPSSFKNGTHSWSNLSVIKS